MKEYKMEAWYKGSSQPVRKTIIADSKDMAIFKFGMYICGLIRIRNMKDESIGYPDEICIVE